jgi:hypothetical protein
MSKLIDLSGTRPSGSRIFVVCPHGRRGVRKELTWLCRCDCGNEFVTTGMPLRKGLTKSCGCLRKETSSITGKSRALPEGESVRNDAYATAIRKARRCGQSFSITKEQYFVLAESPCYYCGSQPFRKFKGAKNLVRCDFVCNGMDRVDSSKGYEIENIVPCCRPCNVAKSDMTQSAFLSLIHKIHTNMVEKLAVA